MYAVNPNLTSRATMRGEVQMATQAIAKAQPRERLTRERVLRAAIAHADAGGLEALTMRTLAEVLGVAPMALYRHVANKDDLV
jgi:AcrR family transcriptional regulator